MMSGLPLETCWAFNKLWNNKFYYKLHLVGISTGSYYDARIHEYQIYRQLDVNRQCRTLKCRRKHRYRLTDFYVFAMVTKCGAPDHSPSPIVTKCGAPDHSPSPIVTKCGAPDHSPSRIGTKCGAPDHSPSPVVTVKSWWPWKRNVKVTSLAHKQSALYKVDNNQWLVNADHNLVELPVVYSGLVIGVLF